MTFEWINTSPGVLVLSGTPFSVRLLNGTEFQAYRGDDKMDKPWGNLFIAKVACENAALELKEIGAL